MTIGKKTAVIFILLAEYAPVVWNDPSVYNTVFSVFYSV